MVVRGRHGLSFLVPVSGSATRALPVSGFVKGEHPAPVPIPPEGHFPSPVVHCPIGTQVGFQHAGDDLIPSSAGDRKTLPEGPAPTMNFGKYFHINSKQKQ